MPFKLKTPGGERTFYALIMLGIGTYVAIKSSLRGDPTLIAFGLLAMVIGVGMWFNQQWARWSGIALGVFCVGFITYKMTQRGFTLWGTVVAICGLWGAWDIW